MGFRAWAASERGTRGAGGAGWGAHPCHANTAVYERGAAFAGDAGVAAAAAADGVSGEDAAAAAAANKKLVVVVHGQELSGVTTQVR